MISQHLENKGTLIYLDTGEEKEVIPHFGDTKGSNEYKDAKSMVQIGWNRFPSDEYLAQCLSRNTNFDKLFEPQEGKTEETARYFENENGHFKKYDKANIYMWRKLAVEFEQEVFRTCVRDFSADNTVDIYIFRPDKKVIDLILQRFKKCHVIYNYDVPKEFEQEKILGRQTADGNDNKIQALVKWLKNEWDGSSISIQEIKDKFDISNKYWGKIVSQKVIKNIKKDRNVKIKKEGSRNNQVYYWFIE